MRLLVLGGSGNLGATLCELARQRGHEVVATCNQHTPAVDGVRLVQWNVAAGPPPQELRAVAADVVVHCVALINPDTCEQEPARARLVNAESVRQAAVLAGSGRLVYVSSDYVFDGRRGNYGEDDPPAPINVYGQTKLLGEQYARGSGHALIVRLALFGAGLPQLPPTRTEQQLALLRRGEEVSVASDQVGTPLWTNSAAALLLALIERGATGVVHAAGPEAIDKASLLRRLAEEFGLAAPRILGTPTAELRPVAARPLNVSLRASAIVTALSEYPPTLDDELQGYRARLHATVLDTACA